MLSALLNGRKQRVVKKVKHIMSNKKQEYLALFEQEYLSKIYGFCRLKTNTETDAEDLSQDIALEVLKAIQKGTEIENMNAFVWKVSNHMFFNFLRKKKYGSSAYLTDIFACDDNVEEEYIFKEQKELLHRELATMPRDYRKAVVMHYFDGLSCEEIGKILGKSAGTVKWWLHDARKVIKEGIDTMKTYGEKSYNPGSLFISCTGNFGANYEPMSCAKRKSAQNILLAAYKTPLTIEELCTELGISAPYIEDEVDFLVENELMKKVGKDKYQTGFVILPGQNPTVFNKIYTECIPEYFEKLISFLESKRTLLSSEKFNLASFPWERLLWVYIHIISDIAANKYKSVNNIHIKYADIPARPNGGKWIAFGFDNSKRVTDVKWEKYHDYDGPCHKTKKSFAQAFFNAYSGSDSSVFFSLPDEVFSLCKQIIKGEKSANSLSEKDKYFFSLALENKLFIKENEKFKQTYYFVEREQRGQLERLSYEFYEEVKHIFKKAYDIVLNKYAAGVPKHLHSQMGNFLSNSFSAFVTCSLFEAKNRGMLSEPDESKMWLSLFASEI